MAVYMKVDGIDGDVSARGHDNWIQVDNLQFDVSRNVTNTAGKLYDRILSQPNFTEITLSKKVDKASSYLLQYACSTKAIDRVEIDVCTTDQELSPYVKYTLEKVIIAEMRHETFSGTTPFEKLRLNFTRLELNYQGRDDANRPRGPLVSGYNLETLEVL
jgi:type VI secretion system secreted protein Hcp